MIVFFIRSQVTSNADSHHSMAATIGIVFTNKAIFNDPAFKLMQTSFASFHFVCTGLTLYIVSRPSIGAFVPKRAGVVEMLPVSPFFSIDAISHDLPPPIPFFFFFIYVGCK